MNIFKNEGVAIDLLHEMLAARVFVFYSDPGHGWLEVPRAWLDLLGLQDKISPYSYKTDRYAYLEEDCDAGVFINAYRDIIGQAPDFVERHEENIFIRDLHSYAS
tara:strand:- start:719 stop:1033 length:315 start_codon:yes stop_codon:yes gene_type:complete